MVAIGQSLNSRHLRIAGITRRKKLAMENLQEMIDLAHEVRELTGDQLAVYTVKSSYTHEDLVTGEPRKHESYWVYVSRESATDWFWCKNIVPVYDLRHFVREWKVLHF